MEVAVTAIPLNLSVDWRNDLLIALASGYVVDGKQESEVLALSAHVAYLLDEPDGMVIGLTAMKLRELQSDPESALDREEIWEGPTFTVPVLGLTDVTAGHIITAALAAHKRHSTSNVRFFERAVSAGSSRLAERYWRECLSAGELKAHFGLGYTLADKGKLREAYAHLRYYTELLPTHAWAWRWRGSVCADLGEYDEARQAYEKTIELEELEIFETDAAEQLEEMEAELAEQVGLDAPLDEPVPAEDVIDEDGRCIVCGQMEIEERPDEDDQDDGCRRSESGVEWDLADIFIPDDETGMAHIPVIQAATARAAELRYAELIELDGTDQYVAAFVEWMAPIIDEGWRVDPWWTQASPKAPYATRMWRLISVNQEELWDTSEDVWWPNPFYRGRWEGFGESPWGFEAAMPFREGDTSATPQGEFR